MSTKLTARKRYLPRVKAGVTEFKKLAPVRLHLIFVIASERNVVILCICLLLFHLAVT